jgi:hypothetical protein
MDGEARLIDIPGRVVFRGCSTWLDAGAAGNPTSGETFLISPGYGMVRHLFQPRLATLVEVINTRKDPAQVEVRGLLVGRLRARPAPGYAVFRECRPASALSDENLIPSLRRRAQEFVFLVNTAESERLIYLMNFITDPEELADFTANYFVPDEGTRRRIYRETVVARRMELVIRRLDTLIAGIGRRKNHE